MAEPALSAEELWIQISGFLSLRDSLVVTSRVHQYSGKVRALDQRQRFELHRLSHFRDRVVVTSERAKIGPRVSVVGDREIRIELKRTFELAFRRCPVPIVSRCDHTSHRMGLRKLRVEFECLCNRGLCLRKTFAGDADGKDGVTAYDSAIANYARRK